MNNKVSVCIICKNEETKIDACLQSVTWADEIVVVDSGSTDGTLDIVRKYTDKIFVREDWPGFGEQKRRAEALASNNWIFSIDSDEVVPEALALEIQNALTMATPEQVFTVNRLTHFCGQFVYHSGWYPDRIARLYNRTQYRYNQKMVHESLACEGATMVDLKNDLLHYTFSDLSVYMQKRMRYAEEWAKEKHKSGKKGSLLKGSLSGIFAFIRHYFLRLGFLDGRIGFLIAAIQCQYTFNKYALLKFKNLDSNTDGKSTDSKD